ncbi:MAG: YhcG family protein [Draconibacterium sp.]
MTPKEKYGSEYTDWLVKLKGRIKQTQLKAALSANRELIFLYWEIGKELHEKQETEGWGNSVVDKLEKDLAAEFPDLKGFSRRNLFYMKGFYLFYHNKFEKVQQLVAQIPWGHNILIFSKSGTINEALFYLSETIENNWSRSILDMQIGTDLYKSQGKAITNFSKALPKPGSDLAHQSLKDPYLFDFLTLKKDADEQNIEDQLTKHITRFLLELGTGFAFIGRQYKLEIGDKDFYLDLLFYHTKLRCYVVVELKAKSFKPEYAGKLSFYLSAVDDKLKTGSDNPTIGIVLCKDKNKIEAEYALRGISQPIGIAGYELSKSVPDKIKSNLPTVEELEKELSSTIYTKGNN